METWSLVVLFAILVEATVQALKAGVSETTDIPMWLWPTAAAVIGVAMCVSAGVDALSALGVEIRVAFIGQTITGVLVSRGASFVHDLWYKVKNRIQVHMDFEELAELMNEDDE